MYNEGSGRGAAWLARLLGVQEVRGSNPRGPTKNSFYCNVSSSQCGTNFGTNVDKTVNEMRQAGRSVNQFPGRSFA